MNQIWRWDSGEENLFLIDFSLNRFNRTPPPFSHVESPWETFYFFSLKTSTSALGLNWAGSCWVWPFVSQVYYRAFFLMSHFCVKWTSGGNPNIGQICSRSAAHISGMDATRLPSGHCWKPVSSSSSSHLPFSSTWRQWKIDCKFKTQTIIPR